MSISVVGAVYDRPPIAIAKSWAVIDRPYNRNQKNRTE